MKDYTRPKRISAVSAKALTSLAVLLVSLAVPGGISAVSRFGTDRTVTVPARGLQLDDIWFYNEDMSRLVPRVDRQWLTVVFYTDPRQRPSADIKELRQEVLRKSRQIAERHHEITDVFYDADLAQDACFFKLGSGIGIPELRKLIRALNEEESVSYSLPALRIENRLYAFFNAFTMTWKTGADAETRSNLLKQAGVWFDAQEQVYRVDIHKRSVFEAANLLAEDIRVIIAQPFFVEIKPLIHAAVTPEMYGCTTGDKVTFSVDVTFSDQVLLDPSSLATINLRPTEIQEELFEIHFDPYDYVAVSSRSPVRITGWMKFYAPGEFTIPPLKLRYSRRGDKGVQDASFATGSIVIKVASIVSSQHADNVLIVPVAPMAPDVDPDAYHDSAVKNLLAGLILLLAACACACWFAVQVYNLQRQKRRAAAARPEDALLDSLLAFLQAPPHEPHWKYAAQAGMLLRRYLLAKYAAGHRKNGGTGRLFADGIEQHIPERFAAQLRHVLTEIDTIVAREETHVQGLDNIIAEIGTIVSVHAGA